MAALLLAGTAFGQDRYLYATLDVNQPLSNTDWIADATKSGLRIGYRVFIQPRFSAGLDLGTVTFGEYNPTETIEGPTGALTTDYFKYIYSYSAVASGQYNFIVGNGEIVFPYAGLGIGANYNTYVKYYNIYDDRENGWGFLVRPEAGVMIKFTKRRSIGLIGAVHFDYSTNSSEMFNYDNFAAAGFQIGLMFLQM